MNTLRSIIKFVIPALFAILGIALIINGMSEKTIDNALCYSSEQ